MALAAAAVMFLADIGYLGGAAISYFPATGMATPAESGTSVLFLSSDMGLRVGMGSSLIGRLTAKGLPVVGINCLTAFRTGKTPAAAAKLVEAGLRRALAIAGTKRVVVIGQSFGADMAQATLSALPAALRQNVKLVVLIVPPDTTLYRASPSEIFSFGDAESPAIATARRLDWVPVLCLQGVEESDSLCPKLTMANVARVALPGGHMLDFDADRLFAAIMPSVRRTLSESDITNNLVAAHTDAIRPPLGISASSHGDGR